MYGFITFMKQLLNILSFKSIIIDSSSVCMVISFIQIICIHFKQFEALLEMFDLFGFES